MIGKRLGRGRPASAAKATTVAPASPPGSGIKRPLIGVELIRLNAVIVPAAPEVRP